MSQLAMICGAKAMSGDVKTNRLVIGLTGPVGSGVSTAAQALRENGFAFVKLSDPMKEELRRREDLGSDSLIDERMVHDFRKKLQDIGNEGRRKSPAYWLDKISLSEPGDIVIDGIRNYGEVQVLRKRYRDFF